MYIYFAGSIRGGRDDKDIYMQLIQYLTSYGEVLTEHIGNTDLTEIGETTIDDAHIYQRDLSRVKKADRIVAEVSTPSLGVGYEIGIAEAMHKPILCLYKDQTNKRLSAMISGNSYATIGKYESIAQAQQYIDNFFAGI